MKDKFTDHLISSLLYSVYMLFSCIVVMFAEIIAVKAVNLFIVVDNLTLCIIRVVVYFIGVNAILAIVSFREGYKSPSRSVLSHTLAAVVAVIWHFIPSLLFNFAAICSGEVRFIAILAKFGKKVASPTFAGTLDASDCIPYFFIIGAIHVTVMVASGYIGAKIRMRDRAALVTDKSEQASSL